MFWYFCTVVVSETIKFLVEQQCIVIIDTYSWYSCRIKTRMCSFMPINPLFVNSPCFLLYVCLQILGLLPIEPATSWFNCFFYFVFTCRQMCSLHPRSMQPLNALKLIWYRLSSCYTNVNHCFGSFFKELLMKRASLPQLNYPTLARLHSEYMAHPAFVAALPGRQPDAPSSS